ncbi:hypothetical protein L226DRAFT_13465 [Lentinus tigrinus ALCF2SS1-7]|uniref:uncharacterized protein n=1 Tax=Lentinus tigrinus ALCF2SS1-7 TaxID=1328758 RepID=UPI0011660ADA|nr:hypothetical protein L226DRAFT_13465 [Lentinus tigrinus ALCF2SS1-7]
MSNSPSTLLGCSQARPRASGRARIPQTRECRRTLCGLGRGVLAPWVWDRSNSSQSFCGRMCNTPFAEYFQAITVHELAERTGSQAHLTVCQCETEPEPSSSWDARERGPSASRSSRGGLAAEYRGGTCAALGRGRVKCLSSLHSEEDDLSRVCTQNR